MQKKRLSWIIVLSMNLLAMPTFCAEQTSSLTKEKIDPKPLSEPGAIAYVIAKLQRLKEIRIFLPDYPIDFSWEEKESYYSRTDPAPEFTWIPTSNHIPKRPQTAPLPPRQKKQHPKPPKLQNWLPPISDALPRSSTTKPSVAVQQPPAKQSSDAHQRLIPKEPSRAQKFVCMCICAVDSEHSSP